MAGHVPEHPNILTSKSSEPFHIPAATDMENIEDDLFDYPDMSISIPDENFLGIWTWRVSMMLIMKMLVI